MNLLAIIVAAMGGTGIGAVWYSTRLFGSQCKHELKLDPRKESKNSVRGAHMLAAAGSFIMAIVLAQIIRIFTYSPTMLDGALVGLIVGIGIVTPAIATNYIFEGRSQRLFLITAGHHVVSLLVMGLIIGLLS